ncbi:lutropin-choriogonadotropic hormone receptor-like isoform X2 [Cylas formicarius]|uniref:lutropin-choriogonadotropic hormone receptor-like isoform X2 n=1 Tax=Cylas formicarius TaxID=197179 RepID=UPI002958A6DA|nr:lutropin-choriogonadotropic hormone receptor-like isoform X2 [Cylas formicarius]
MCEVMRYMVFIIPCLLVLQPICCEMSYIMDGFKENTTTVPYQCDTFTHEEDYEVHCYGKYLTEIPRTLNTSLNKLIITDSDLKFLTRNSFQAYANKLQDVTLSGLRYIRVIEEGAFANIPNLRTIYIYNAPELKFLHGLLKDVTSTNFKTLRIVNTGLHDVPDFIHLPPENTMFLLDLDHNKIEKLESNSIKVSALQVTINFNSIVKIEDYAFNGSQIGRLHIRANPKLTELGDNAFSGMQNLRELDLSQTSIKNLPYVGLEAIETLKILDTPSLQTVPSLYDLSGLRVAKLTHHFHCCAFKYPQQHSPSKHAAYQETMQQFCMQAKVNDFKKRKRSTDYTNYKFTQGENDRNLTNFTSPLISSTLQAIYNRVHEKQVKELAITPLRGQFIGHQKPREEDSLVDEDVGVFHSQPTKINKTAIDIFCGNITFRKQNVNCIPEPNDLNPCEDIMGFTWLRNAVWLVVILAVVGFSFAI